MSPVTVNLVRCRIRAACPACSAALLKCAIKREGRTITFDRDDAAAWAAFLAFKKCDHPAPVTAAVARTPATIRALCPYRVKEWLAVRGEARWLVLNGLRTKGGGWRIDLADERVKAFLTEEGDAAKVLLSPCP